jgi:hypothetical protein
LLGPLSIQLSLFRFDLLMSLTLSERWNLACSVYSQVFPPKPTWGVDDIPDLSGKIAIVTGGYSGELDGRSRPFPLVSRS